MGYACCQCAKPAVVFRREALPDGEEKDEGGKVWRKFKPGPLSAFCADHIPKEKEPVPE